jgi:moderate conductance mechanosensitive channel
MRRYASATVWLALSAAVALVAVSAALSHYGIADLRVEPRQVSEWVLGHGLRIALIIAAGAIVVRAASYGITAFQTGLGYGEAHDLEWQRRASTLGGILIRLVTVVVWFVAGMMLLRELTIDVMPILTGAGIVGLAVGFGAQNLVRDVISGFFMILEDQLRVGDSARVNGVTGQVEQVNLRTIVMRDAEGAVHVFPNGTITALANLSKRYSFAIVDVRVPFTENMDRVLEAIQEVGARMKADPHWAPLVFGDIESPGIESMDQSAATVRARYRTQPLNQGKVANELRRRLLAALGEKGIRPYTRAR